VSVPDVVGRSQNAATRTLSGRGFEVTVDEVGVDSRREDGIVVEQSPAGGEPVERGSTVTITVGRFDPDADPPPVTTTTPPASTTTTPAGVGSGP
jgi:eukaryotic-like serine/threonine-protein kinase